MLNVEQSECIPGLCTAGAWRGLVLASFGQALGGLQLSPWMGQLLHKPCCCGPEAAPSSSPQANPALTYGNKVAALEGFAIQLTSKYNRQRLAAIFKCVHAAAQRAGRRSGSQQLLWSCSCGLQLPCWYCSRRSPLP